MYLLVNQWKLLYKAIKIVLLYRPPRLSVAGFIKDCFQLMSDYMATVNSHFFSLGDFKIHAESKSKAASQFRDCLQDLQQHVNIPTHSKEHILDLIITKQDSIIVNNIN